MAEGEGFEPPVPVKVQRFSRPPVSTAHASLRPAISLPAAPILLPQTCANTAHHCSSAFVRLPSSLLGLRAYWLWGGKI
jgi:hypothetical protein